MEIKLRFQISSVVSLGPEWACVALCLRAGEKRHLTSRYRGNFGVNKQINQQEFI